MRAIFPLRAQIESMPGGEWVSRTFRTLVDAINTQPVYIGEAATQSGAGSPQGRIVGSPGDVYLNTTGGTGTTLYIKESGRNTSSGWVAK